MQKGGEADDDAHVSEKTTEWLMSVLIATAILFPYGMAEDDAAGKEIRGVILATSDMNGNIWDFSYEKTEKPATERLHLSCQMSFLYNSK